jgi:hypothetical protein
MGIVLDPESWDRIITWIDLNTPAHGTWHEIVGCEKVDHLRDRRMAMQINYAQGRGRRPRSHIRINAAGERHDFRNSIPGGTGCPPTCRR